MKSKSISILGAVTAVISVVVCLMVLGNPVHEPDKISPSVSSPEPVNHTPVSIPPETITGRCEAVNGFAWNYGYDLQVKDGVLIVRAAINLVPAKGVTRPDLGKIAPLWEAGIERIWGNAFVLETGSGERYPIVVDVTFRGPHFHHDVIVRPGSGRTDELNWNIQDRPELVAHEFGHMIGMYDEYEKGALAPKTKMVDATSIMTSNPTSGVTHARHYNRFLTWFQERARLGDVALTANDSGTAERRFGMRTGAGADGTPNRTLAANVRGRMYP